MFDPYHRWLGIPKDARPPTHYQLLGLAAGENDQDVIDEAAIRQTTHVRAYQIGAHAEQCTKLLNEIALAKATLLNPVKKKSYDDSLTSKMAPTGITAQPAVRRPALLDDLDVDDERVVAIARPRSHRRSAAAVYWIVGGGVAAVVLIAALVIGLLLSKTTDKVDVAGGPGNQRKDGPNKAAGQPKKIVPANVAPEPVVPATKDDAPAEPTGKKLEEKPAQPEKKGGGGFGFTILLHKQICSSVALPGDRTIAAAATNPARIIDAKTLKLIDTITDPEQNRLTNVKVMAFTRDGAKLLIACGNYGAMIAVYDVAAKNLRFLQRKENVSGDYIAGAALSSLGRFAASTHIKGRIVVFDVESSAEMRVLDPGVKQLDCRFLSDQKTLLTAGADGVVRLWDVETGNLKKQFDFARQEPNNERVAIACLDVSPDDRWVLYGHGNFFRRFDLQTETAHPAAILHRDKVVGVAMSPDGEYIGSVDVGGDFRVLGQNNRWSYRGHVNLTKVNGLAFGPGNETLWFASDVGLAPVAGWRPPNAQN